MHREPQQRQAIPKLGRERENLTARRARQRTTDKVIDRECAGVEERALRQKEINTACAEFWPSLFYIDPLSSKMAPECKT